MLHLGIYKNDARKGRYKSSSLTRRELNLGKTTYSVTAELPSTNVIV